MFPETQIMNTNFMLQERFLGKDNINVLQSSGTTKHNTLRCKTKIFFETLLRQKVHTYLIQIRQQGIMIY